MSITVRQYKTPDDFYTIGQFLVENYQSDNRDGNFLQPAWEYMHSHPLLNEGSLDKMGIWEDSGRIIGVVHYEWYLGEAFFEIHPRYTYLKPEMLEYAENYLFGETQEGRRYVKAYVNDFDAELESLVLSSGYEKDDTQARPMSKLKMTLSFRPVVLLPDGFNLKSLVEENEPAKIELALWRGFNNPGEPPWDVIEGSRKKQSVPSFQNDLNIIIIAPDGNYVAYAGTWFEASNKFAYIEPVATDPDYRRMGLSKAAVLEGLRRCRELGARVAYVGSDQIFYQALGFRKIFTSNCWVKYFN